MTDEHRFTAAELEELADLLAPRIAAKLQAHVCQFQDTDVAELRAIAAASRKAKSTAFATFIGAAVLFLLGALWYGIVERIKGK